MKNCILLYRLLVFFIAFYILVFTFQSAKGRTNDVASAYIFSQSISQYNPVSNGVVLNDKPGHRNLTYGPFPIGFTFNFCGTEFNTIAVSDNGWVQIGAVYQPIGLVYNMICYAALVNVICPFNGILYGNYDTLRYLISGTAPNRSLTIEWAHWGFWSTGGLDEISFELKLFETTNIIQFMYHPTNPQTTVQNLQVGMMGAARTDYAVRTTISDWTLSTAGTACSYMYFVPPNVTPPDGLTYTFTPPPPCMVSSFPLGYGFGSNNSIDQCWTFEHVIGSRNWSVDSVCFYPDLHSYQGICMAVFPSFGSPPTEARIKSPQLNFASISYPEMSFYMSRDNLYPAQRDSLIVEVTTNNGVTWNYAASYQRYSTNTAPYWEQKLIDLAPYSGNNNVHVGIRGVSLRGADICVDTIVIKQVESVPAVTTSIVGATGSSTAKCVGLVTSNNVLYAVGVCWNTTGNPTIADPHTNDGTSVSWASFITGLTSNQLYHVRAYATNAVGTGYGNNLTFTTCSTFTLPYTEGFVGISSAGSWPCGWSSQNTYYVTTGLGSGCLTQNSASFLYSNSSKWVFTPGLNLMGGNQYVFSVWYKTDGVPGWLTFQAKYGTRPDSAAMIRITGAAMSNPTNTNCVQLTGTFTPSTNGIYFIGLNCIDNGVPWFFTFDDILLTGPNGISNNDNQIPKSYCLYQNYPNPFNPTTKIKFDVASNVKREMSNVKLMVYDILGREVTTIVQEELNAGSYEISLNGSGYSSGLYFYRLIVDGNIIDTKKMLLMK